MPGAVRADSYVAGNRAFVPTLLTDDPFVADEITTTATRIRTLAADGEPAGHESDYGWSIAKRITPDLGLELEDGYSIVAPEGLRRSYGFDNLEATLKYQLYVDPAHELLVSAGISHEFGSSGSRNIAEAVGATTPTLYFGKGMGDLPAALAWLRPIAVTGTLGYSISDRGGSAHPDSIAAGFALEYNLRYLEGNVRYLALPEAIDRMTPVLEFDWSGPIGPAPGIGGEGHVAPGLVYSANSFDLGAEAAFPLARGMHEGVSFLAMFHLRLEPLFPFTIGRPLFGCGGE